MRNLTRLVLGSMGVLVLSACSTGKLGGDSTKKSADNALTTNDGGTSANATGTTGTTGTTGATNDPSAGTGGNGSGTTASTGSGSGSSCPTAMALTSHDDDKDKIAVTNACNDATPITKGIKKCLDNWGGAAPFTIASPYRKIAAAVTVLGFGNAIDDSATTTDPQLVIIAAAVSVLSQPHYRLMNPKGWYCLIADVNVGSKLNIDLQTNAHLADARVNVGVLSSGANAGVVDVNVLSDVQVNRVDK